MKKQICNLSLFIVTFICLIKKSYQDEDLNYIYNITWDMSLFMKHLINYEQYSGFIPVGNKTLFHPQTDTSFFTSVITKEGTSINQTDYTTPVIFWFGGGPGCTSQYGNWVEIGPLKINSTQQPVINPHSWNKQAHLVFIDQPLGAGLAYTQYENVNVYDTEKAVYFYEIFIKKFYKKFKGLEKNPTYYMGEGFAGNFIPHFFEMLLKKQPVQDLNLKGIALGNAWIDPEIQFKRYSDFFYNIGIESQQEREEMKNLTDLAVSNIQNNNFTNAFDIYNQIIDNKLFGDVDNENFNFYNAQQQNPNTQTYFSLLMKNTVFQMMFGIDELKQNNFKVCNDTVFHDFSGEFAKSSKQQLEYLLKNQDLNILLYSGQLDTKATIPGTQDLINKLNWDELESWQKSKKKILYQGNSKVAVYGNQQTFDNFSYEVIYNAGQSVPSDQPEAASELLRRFLKWEY